MTVQWDDATRNARLDAIAHFDVEDAGGAEAADDKRRGAQQDRYYL